MSETFDVDLADFNERELEILRLIGAGKTNREIGSDLFISVNTVRWYNKQIYTKLGVHKRTLAVARARELGLLQDNDHVTSDAPRQVLNNLPMPTTGLVGRANELDLLADLLTTSGQPLVTLVGLGGVGKTRLAVEVARRNLDHFRDGALFVSCAPLNRAADMIPMLARMLEIDLPDRVDPSAEVLAALAERELLLVLDNLEHLKTDVGIITEIMQQAPCVTLLATSREQLNIPGEHVVQINGLANTPIDAGDAIQTDAMTLFIQSARRCNPQFRMTENDLNAVARIANMVEGMPLALEIAAAWSGILTPEEIAAEIAQGLDFLQSQSPHMPERHRSVSAVMGSTWQMLTDAQRRTYAALSVFRCGFTREAAEIVANADLHLLLAFNNKSILRYDPSRKRYELHELLRQYAEGQLHQPDDADTIYAAFVDYFLSLLDDYAQAPPRTQRQALSQMEADYENIKTALYHRLTTIASDPPVDAALDAFYRVSSQLGRFQSGFRLLDDVLTQTAVQNDADTTVALREYRGRFAAILGTYDVAIADLEAVYHQLKRQKPSRRWLELLLELGQLHRRADHSNRARHYLNDALQQARKLGDMSMVVSALYHLGTVVWDEGDNHTARQYYDEGVKISQQHNLDDLAAAQVYHGLAESYMFGAQPEQAIRAYRQSLAIAERVNDLPLKAENQIMLGWMMTSVMGIDDFDQARHLLRAGVEISNVTHIDWHKICSTAGLGLVEGSHGNYQEGLHLVDDAVNTSEALSPVRLRSFALDQRGVLLQQLNLLDEAERAHQEAVEIAQSVEYAWWLPRAMANLAIDRLRQGRLNVEGLLNDAYNMAMTNGQEVHALCALQGIAELHLARQQPRQALESIEQLSSVAETRLFPAVAAQTRYLRGVALLLLQRYDEAQTHLEHALSEGNRLSRPRLMWECHSALARLHHLRDDIEQANHHERQVEHIIQRIASNLTDSRLREQFKHAAATIPVLPLAI